MRFFKPEDFKPTCCPEIACNEANAKLEREGKVVRCEKNRSGYARDWSESYKVDDTHRALLICVEPIEKCEHPPEKIKRYENPNNTYLSFYSCECGARVKPKSFEVVE